MSIRSFSLKIPGVECNMLEESSVDEEKKPTPIERPKSLFEKRREKQFRDFEKVTFILDAIENSIRCSKSSFTKYKWTKTKLSPVLCEHLLKYDSVARMYYHNCYRCGEKITESSRDGYCLRLIFEDEDASKVICSKCFTDEIGWYQESADYEDYSDMV